MADKKPNAEHLTCGGEFTEFGVISCFSFLRGASEPSDLVQQAKRLGYTSIGLADVNSMAGVVRFYVHAKEVGLRPIIGCRIETAEGLCFLAYPHNREGYGQICRLISAGRMRALDGSWQDKGRCTISLTMLAMLAGGRADITLIILPPDDMDQRFTMPAWASNVTPIHAQAPLSEVEAGFAQAIPHLCAGLPALTHIAVSYLYRGDDIARITQIKELAHAHGLRIIATNNVHYHVPSRRPLHDVMTAIRHNIKVAEAGPLLLPNAEHYLKPPREMVRLFAAWPEALAAAEDLAKICQFDLGSLRYEYPREIYPEGMSAQAFLEHETWKRAAGRYPDGIPEDVRATLMRELALIAKMDMARYFLTIKDIVDFARTQDPPILCQGRGSAANSAVCYCLGITSVDPAKHQLLFERFISEDRKEPPDIDVDFEHERREEVIQHIYAKYGRERAGLCATVIHYRPRMAIREVGKVMGLSSDTTGVLARTFWGSSGRQIEDSRLREAGLDLSDPYLRRTVKLAEQLIGMPRHLSQHVGGFILTQGPLVEMVPIGNGAMADRSFIEWDKNDIEALGILKMDVLALGMLTCIRKALDLLAAHYDQRRTLATIPREDPCTYDMLCKGDSLGVFQVESRAQMNMLPRLRPREFYDLVIQVAIVRPGPIQGDMVHPYLRRRRGEEAVVLPAPSPHHGPPDELSSILARTLGVPIFQEQAMKIALDAAKFSGAEANRLRKAMATFRRSGHLEELEDIMVERMTARGYQREFAIRCFNQIKGFGEYGFPESHAASFAHLVYVSSWLKCHFPAVFACALLNAQPMGFYAPAQIVRDARAHGVRVLPVDINHSQWDCTLEGDEAEYTDGRIWSLRLGFRQIDGMAEHVAARIMAARDAKGHFAGINAVYEHARISLAHIERLASADCFGSMGLTRRQALWHARSLIEAPDLPLFSHHAVKDTGEDRAAALLPIMPLREEVVTDYQTTRLSLKAHPLVFLRAELAERGFVRCSDVQRRDWRGVVRVAGVVLIRQRPATAKGVCFITIEDETGVANIVVWPDLMEKQRKIVMGARVIEVQGRAEYDGDVVHIIAQRLTDATARLDALAGDEQNMDAYGAATANVPHRGHPRDARIIPKSRDFH